MGTIHLDIPQVGLPNTTEDPKIATDLTTIQTVINGNIDTNNLNSAAGVKRTQLAPGASFPNNARHTGVGLTANYGDLIIADAVIGVVLPVAVANALVAIVCGNAGPVTISAQSPSLILAPTVGFVSDVQIVGLGGCYLFGCDGSTWILVSINV